MSKTLEERIQESEMRNFRLDRIENDIKSMESKVQRLLDTVEFLLEEYK